MKRLLAWRILVHEKGRSALAISGIFIAVLMIFLQLGFYSAVPKGGMLVYDKMRFDLMLTSSAYYFQGQSFDFPRRRLYQALALPEVASAAPVYMGSAQWLNPATGVSRDIFVMGFNLRDDVFIAPDLNRQLTLLERPDVVLVDRATRPFFGPLIARRHVELNERDVEIGGSYELGTGFAGLGAVATSDLNFLRIFPARSLSAVNLGLIMLWPGGDPDAVAAQLRALLPLDTRVFTRGELVNYEIVHWVSATSTGLVFGFGAVISVVVGIVILYQILATEIRRHLSQYAVLKAIGYRDGFLAGVVVVLAVTMALLAYVPAVVASLVIYQLVRGMTLLPIAMTGERLVVVLLISLAMSAGSALVSIRVLRRADPVQLF